MGLPCLVTQTETQKHDAAEQPVDKPGNQNPGEEVETWLEFSSSLNEVEASFYLAWMTDYCRKIFMRNNNTVEPALLTLTVS